MIAVGLLRRSIQPGISLPPGFCVNKVNLRIEFTIIEAVLWKDRFHYPALSPQRSHRHLEDFIMRWLALVAIFLFALVLTSCQKPADGGGNQAAPSTPPPKAKDKK